MSFGQKTTPAGGYPARVVETDAPVAVAPAAPVAPTIPVEPVAPVAPVTPSEEPKP